MHESDFNLYHHKLCSNIRSESTFLKKADRILTSLRFFLIIYKLSIIFKWHNPVTFSSLFNTEKGTVLRLSSVTRICFDVDKAIMHESDFNL